MSAVWMYFVYFVISCREVRFLRGSPYQFFFSFKTRPHLSINQLSKPVLLSSTIYLTDAGQTPASEGKIVVAKLAQGGSARFPQNSPLEGSYPDRIIKFKKCKHIAECDTRVCRGFRMRTLQDFLSI